MKKVLIHAIPDYVTGHLRYGHYEGILELTDEEFEEFKEEPGWFEDEIKELDFLVDDYRIDDIGNNLEIDYKIIE